MKLKRHVIKHGLDWIGKTWTGLIKHGVIKHLLFIQNISPILIG